MSYFPEQFNYTLNKIKVEINVFKYPTKSGLKSKIFLVTSKFIKKGDLVMMQKYLTLRLHDLLHLVIVNLRLKK